MWTAPERALGVVAGLDRGGKPVGCIAGHLRDDVGAQVGGHSHGRVAQAVAHDLGEPTRGLKLTAKDLEVCRSWSRPS